MSPRALSATVAAACVLLATVPAAAQNNLTTRQSKAASLRAAVATETRRIDATARGVSEAQSRLDRLNAELTDRRTKLLAVGRELIAARKRLLRLENRMREASAALAANLLHDYQTPEPDFVSIVAEADSFAELLELREFLNRIARRDAEILDNARGTRIAVSIEADRLVGLQARNRKLAAEIARRRDRADAVRAAIAGVHARQVARRNGKAAQLRAIEAQISAIRRRQLAEARRAARLMRTQAPDGIRLSAGVASAPPGAPAAVVRVIAAGNSIAGLPYRYGGGHGSFQDSAYDCSGSISYALAAAGLVSSPMASTGFMSWGEAGPGKWITVYANAGHAFMVVGGWRFDTSARSSGGTRWTRAMRPTGGFVARHPPGL